MQKVILNRFWLMSGRWTAMTLEAEGVRPRFIEKAWFRSIHAPYWRGSGVSIQVGPWALQCGRCTKGLDVAEPEGDFDWTEFEGSFGEHLDASLFEAAEDNTNAHIGVSVVPEPVTAFVDTRTNYLTAVVHEGGEVEYVGRADGQAVQSS